MRRIKITYEGQEYWVIWHANDNLTFIDQNGYLGSGFWKNGRLHVCDLPSKVRHKLYWYLRKYGVDSEMHIS